MDSTFPAKHSGRSRRGRLLALLATTPLLVPLGVTSAQGQDAPLSDPADVDAPTAPALTPSKHRPVSDAPDHATGALEEPVSVTLITGDTVYWSDAGDGTAYVEDIEQAPRDVPVTFDQSGTHEDFYVIPSDVMEQVVSGVVDMELFNIPSLIRQGLDDRSTGGELPVIVTFDEDAEEQQLEDDANSLPAAGKAQGIEGIQGAGVTVSRGQAAQFREAVLGQPARQGGPGTQSQSESLDGPVDKVLLDQILEIDLAESVPQIGAPGAWEAGFTGEGVTVAVLDTGVDASHPDLVGQVAEAVTFVDSPAFAVDQLDEPLPYIGMEAAAPVPSSGSSEPLVHVGRACVDSMGDVLPADPAGTTALIVRGECTFAEKYDAAVEAGATAVLVYNNEAGNFFGTIEGADHAGEVWAAHISDTAGAALVDLLDAGDQVVLEFTQGFVGDDHGHGTHVAATIAGTGAASDGDRRGAAPDADLLSGKVCNSGGSCPTSAILAGMEWAAARGADIVNMSLGSGSASDGTDVMSQLVNQLSEEMSTLFVTSAGNSGPGAETVGSPGAADAALAVGAVDKDDQMAGFSSRGPRFRDFALKPEISAPGVDIVAARGTGTGLGSPVDDHYTMLSGTSMAAPHVAGAAALLAQANPNLGSSELKDALVSTAADVGHGVFAQGAGRVDVAHAVDSPVYAQGTVHFPDVEAQPEQDITYTNYSDNDVTLSLRVEVSNRSGQTSDGVTLSTDTLTVPAGGQAAVTVIVDAGAVSGVGPFGGAVTATGDGVALRTAIGFEQPDPTVTIEVLDTNGDRVGSDTAMDVLVTLVHDSADWDLDSCCRYPEVFTNDGVATVQVKPGIYTLFTTVYERDPDTGEWASANIVVDLEVAIRANTSVTLDARDAEPVQVTVPQEAHKRAHSVNVVRVHPNPPDGRRFGASWSVSADGYFFPVVRVTPTPPSDLGSGALGMLVGWTLAEPQPRQHLPWRPPHDCDWPTRHFNCYSATPAYIYNLAFSYENGIPNSLHETVTHKDDLVAVPNRYHHDKADALLQLDSHPVSESFGAKLPPIHTRIFVEPGEVTEYYSTNDHVSWARYRAQLDPGDRASLLAQRGFDRFPTAEAGSRRPVERWFDAPMRTSLTEPREEYLADPIVSSLGLYNGGAVRGGPDGHDFRVPDGWSDNARSHYVAAGSPVTREWRMWNLDTGAQLAGSPFHLSPEKASYRLELVEEPKREGEDPLAPGVGDLLRTGSANTTVWTFASRPSDARVPDGYQCRDPDPFGQKWWDVVCQIQPLINLEYHLSLDIYNQAPAGGRHAFTVTAGHHSKAIDRARVTDLTVEASFDDGDTWSDAEVVSGPTDTFETGGFLPASAPYQAFDVELDIPPLDETNRFVALRVQAEDANGGTIDQSIERAYILTEADDQGEDASLESLREMVSSLAADGEVTRRGENRLLNLVDRAERFADRGQTGKAIELLEEFQGLVADPKLVATGSARDALIEEAERLIATLRDTRSGSGRGSAGRGAGGGATALPI